LKIQKLTAGTKVEYKEGRTHQKYSKLISETSQSLLTSSSLEWILQGFQESITTKSFNRIEQILSRTIPHRVIAVKDGNIMIFFLCSQATQVIT
jgi:hypothetical protein